MGTLKYSSALLCALTITIFGLHSKAQEQIGNLLECDYIDMTESKERGQTLLSLIQTKIKSQLDSFVDNGY
ncbi:MAG: hypothetical protein AB8E15_10455, partial [Bdellovibrionales bacterium]